MVMKGWLVMVRILWAWVLVGKRMKSYCLCQKRGCLVSTGVTFDDGISLSWTPYPPNHILPAKSPNMPFNAKYTVKSHHTLFIHPIPWRPFSFLRNTFVFLVSQPGPSNIANIQKVRVLTIQRLLYTSRSRRCHASSSFCSC